MIAQTELTSTVGLQLLPQTATATDLRREFGQDEGFLRVKDLKPNRLGELQAWIVFKDKRTATAFAYKYRGRNFQGVKLVISIQMGSKGTNPIMSTTTSNLVAQPSANFQRQHELDYNKPASYAQKKLESDGSDERYLNSGEATGVSMAGGYIENKKNKIISDEEQMRSQRERKEKLKK